jgi:hypothetical protein
MDRGPPSAGSDAIILVVAEISLSLARMGTQRRIGANALLKGYDKVSKRSRSDHRGVEPGVAAKVRGV